MPEDPGQRAQVAAGVEVAAAGREVVDLDRLDHVRADPGALGELVDGEAEPASGRRPARGPMTGSSAGSTEVVDDQRLDGRAGRAIGRTRSLRTRSPRPGRRCRPAQLAASGSPTVASSAVGVQGRAPRVEVGRARRAGDVERARASARAAASRRPRRPPGGAAALPRSARRRGRSSASASRTRRIARPRRCSCATTGRGSRQRRAAGCAPPARGRDPGRRGTSASASRASQREPRPGRAGEPARRGGQARRRAGRRRVGQPRAARRDPLGQPRWRRRVDRGPVGRRAPAGRGAEHVLDAARRRAHGSPRQVRPSADPDALVRRRPAAGCGRRRRPTRCGDPDAAPATAISAQSSAEPESVARAQVGDGDGRGGQRRPRPASAAVAAYLDGVGLEPSDSGLGRRRSS